MPQLKILVVEDSPTQLLKTRMPLLNSGYQVVTAANGEEGFVAAQTHKPSLILLDMEMPVLDGPGMMAKLKEDPQVKDIPVVMLTAASDSESIVKVVNLGVKDYMVKPFDIATFEQKARKIFPHVKFDESPAERIAAEIDRRLIRYDYHEGTHIFEVHAENFQVGLKMVFSYIRRLLASGEHSFVLDLTPYPVLEGEGFDLLAASVASLQKAAEDLRFIAPDERLKRRLRANPDLSKISCVQTRLEVLKQKG